MLLLLFRSRSQLQVEILVLRQQLIVLRRTAPKRVRLRALDRLLFVLLYRLWPGILDAVAVIRPDTIVRWHRRGFRALWWWKSRRRLGRMLFGFVVLHHGRRQLVHVGVTAHPTAEWLSHQISEAFPWDRAPRHLIRDRDGALWRDLQAAAARHGDSGSPNCTAFAVAERLC